MEKVKKAAFILVAPILLLVSVLPANILAATQQQGGSVGVEGVIPGAPPSQGATIDIPKNGQVFSSIPIIVSGLCPNNTIVEIYKNNVLAGSTECQNGSFTLQIDLFDGRNDLTAKVLDALNQEGPKSNKVTVSYTTNIPSSRVRILLTSQYSKRGANPGDILSWPVTLSGGNGPYAISVDWGDKSTQDLISQQLPGDLNLQHTYAQSGVYKVTIKASDSNGDIAFLQVVGIANGPIQRSSTPDNSQTPAVSTKVAWWPLGIFFALSVIAYWLGQKHQLEAIRKRLRKGEQPF